MRQQPGGCGWRDGFDRLGVGFVHVVAAAFDFDTDQLAADRHHLTGLAAQGQYLAADRRGDLHGGFVGHDIGYHLVFGDHIADLDEPLHQLDLCDAFADVRHLDDVRAHSDLHDPFQCRTYPRRSWEVSPFLCMGIGVSQPVTRSIGASR